MEALKSAAQKYSRALVSFSGGKDSLVVLDMSLRTFEHVEAIYMYFVPNLQFMDERLAEASRRFGVKIHQYPSFDFYNQLRAGTYSFEWFEREKLPELHHDDIYGAAMKELDFQVLVSGHKQSDFMFRRLNLGRNASNISLLYPIASWSRFDVLSYLKARDIPVPSGANALTNSVDLSPINLLWLYDHFPADFKRLCEFFPFAQAVVERRNFYGDFLQRKKRKAAEQVQKITPKGYLR